MVLIARNRQAKAKHRLYQPEFHFLFHEGIRTILHTNSSGRLQDTLVWIDSLTEQVFVLLLVLHPDFQFGFERLHSQRKQNEKRV